MDRKENPKKKEILKLIATIFFAVLILFATFMSMPSWLSIPIKIIAIGGLLVVIYLIH